MSLSIEEDLDPNYGLDRDYLLSVVFLEFSSWWLLFGVACVVDSDEK